MAGPRLRLPCASGVLVKDVGPASADCVGKGVRILAGVPGDGGQEALGDVGCPTARAAVLPTGAALVGITGMDGMAAATGLQGMQSVLQY
jgi:hypothetical protein